METPIQLIIQNNTIKLLEKVNDLNTARQFSGEAGEQKHSSFVYCWWCVSNNESWNGTNWTELGDLNATKRDPASGGTTTAAIAAGGGPPTTNSHRTLDGSSWTEVSDMNNARNEMTGSAQLIL